MLRNHVGEVLKTIAADLTNPKTAHARDKKNKEHRPLRYSAAAAHGADRLAAGFSLIAAIEEYQALHATVIRLWQKEHSEKTAPETAIADIIRFDDAIFQAISDSVEAYTNEKEQHSRVFETILNTTPDLIFTLDLEGRFVYGNKAMTELYELSLDEIVGKNFADLALPNAAEKQRKIQEAIQTKKQVRGEALYTSPSGTSGLYEYLFVPVLTNEGDVEAVAGTSRNITDRKAAEHLNWEKANYDLLTALPNRRLFRDRLEQDVKHAARIGRPIALLFIDLDHFKEANDQFGHEAGDLILRIATERMLSCVRETDTVARLGGDEFTVILQDLNDAGHVELVAEKIVKELASPYPIADQSVDLSASVGIALCPQDGATPDQLINNADQAMYAAKRAGRNRLSFFSPHS
ncbi:MAG: diguanylate cyclase domain-containing protein [Burkholderiaceae bacterium]